MPLPPVIQAIHSQFSKALKRGPSTAVICINFVHLFCSIYIHTLLYMYALLESTYRLPLLLPLPYTAVGVRNLGVTSLTPLRAEMRAGEPAVLSAFQWKEED